MFSMGFTLGPFCLEAQQLHNVKNIAGNSFTSDSYYFEWSVGELAGIKTVTTDRLTVTEGFCQTLMYPLRSGGDERNSFKKPFQLLPNPCQTEVFVVSYLSTPVNADALLIDDQGRIHQRQLLYLHNESKATIKTSQLIPGHYKVMLRIKDKNGQAQIYSYDIIKY
jgi:hypothetical protein